MDERLDASSLYSQLPLFRFGPRHDRCADGHATEGWRGIEGRRRYPPAAARSGLLVAGRLHHARGEFQRFRYFSGRELSPDRPLLFLVAPALHVHPATDTLLHYVSPEIEWLVVGIDERWRDGVRAVFRKRPRDMELKLDPRSLDPMSRDCA